MDSLTLILSALAEPTRCRALALVSERGELCVCEMMRLLGATQSRMSRHMTTLKAAGLVLDRRAAQWVHYRLNPDIPPHLAPVVAAIIAAARVSKDAADANGVSVLIPDLIEAAMTDPKSTRTATP